MPKALKDVTLVKGGRITRDPASGRFEAVQTVAGQTTRLTDETARTVQAASNKRRDALQRLADR